jgi:methionine aminotransferase
MSSFYVDGKDAGIVRFCFAKQDATLELALSRLAQL